MRLRIDGILLGVHLVLLGEVSSFGFLKLVHIIVEVKRLVVAGDLDEASRDVGAMVGYALEVGEDIRKNEAKLDGTLVLLHSDDMVYSYLILEVVHYLLKRLYLESAFHIGVDECICGQLTDLSDCAIHSFKLTHCLIGERDVLVLDLLCGFDKVD